MDINLHEMRYQDQIFMKFELDLRERRRLNMSIPDWLVSISEGLVISHVCWV